MHTPKGREEQLLLCCARTTLTAEEVCRLKELVREEMDWSRVLQLSVRHALLPLLYNNLKQYCPEFIPDKLLTLLKNSNFKNCTSNLFLTGSLLHVLGLFRKNNIEVVPFKGPLLAAFIYGDIALRSFGDLDIFISQKDLQQSYSLLHSLDYLPEIPLNHKQLVKYSFQEDNLSFFCKEKKVLIELHWELSGLYLTQSLTYERLQAEFKQVEFSGHLVNTLSDEYLLVYLCVHGAKHMWERLEWVCGVAELVRAKHDLNWVVILEFSKSLQCKRMLLLGLFLAHRLLEVKLPVRILEMIKGDERLQGLMEHVCGAMFPEMLNAPGFPVKKRFSYFHMLVRDRYSDSLQYLLRLCFRPTNVEWQTIGLPASLSFLYYFIRPVRLAFEFLYELRLSIGRNRKE